MSSLVISRSSRRRLVVVLALAALLLGLAPSAAPPAAAAPLFGNDVSWPQCPPAQGGFGLPMPPASADFVIIGLTRGLPFTENPCVTSQVQWAQTNRVPAHAYTIPAFPTAAQLSTHRAAGPWAPSTRAGQLRNVGYAQARFALDTMARIGFRPPVVWVDVEPRPAQPWPTATAAQRQENRYVVEGVLRGLRDAGLGFGLYSYHAGWDAITGSWQLPTVPVWATAGRLDYPQEALDRCRQPSFSGGHVYISQWYDDTRDYDRTCEPYPFSPIAVARDTGDACPARVPEDGFRDVPASSPFEAAVDCITYWQITRGTSATTYSPGSPVTRGQMASFVARLVLRSGGSLPTGADAFDDDEGSPYEADVNRLAAAGIVKGTGPATYSPARLVTRAQMAAFLVRAYDYRAGQEGVPSLVARRDFFRDDESTTLEASINAAATAGIAAGNVDGTYRPREAVRRDHMAAFLTRELDLMVENGMSEVP